MNFKRFNGTTWETVQHKRYGSGTENLERTKNLFDKNNADITNLFPVVASQSLAAGSSTTYSVILPCEPNTTYTVSRKIMPDTRANRVGGTSAYPENGMQCTFIDDQTETVGNEWTWNTFTTDANTHYIVCWILLQATEQQLTEALRTLMIEKADDRTSYEPYGFKFQASGEAMTDYTIYGNTGGVGDKTKNLFDKNNADAVHLRPGKDANAIVATGTNGWSIILPVKPSTTYTISKLRIYAWQHWVGGTANYPVVGETLTFIDDQSDTVVGDWAQNIFTTSADTHWIICWIVFSGTEQDLINACNKLMVEESNGRTSYEPYGYKIPVTSGGVTTNLYTDSPLGLTDTLTYTDTGIALPTVDGDNTITFGTSVQPSAMSATFKGWHPVQGAKQYDGSEWR